MSQLVSFLYPTPQKIKIFLPIFLAVFLTVLLKFHLEPTYQPRLSMFTLLLLFLSAGSYVFFYPLLIISWILWLGLSTHELRGDVAWSEPTLLGYITVYGLGALSAYLAACMFVHDRTKRAAMEIVLVFSVWFCLLTGLLSLYFLMILLPRHLSGLHSILFVSCITFFTLSKIPFHELRRIEVSRKRLFLLIPYIFIISYFFIIFSDVRY